MTPSRILFIPSLYSRVYGGSLTGADIVLNTQYDLGYLRRFPVMFHNEDESIQGYASLSLGLSSDRLLTFDDNDGQSDLGDEESTDIEFFTARTDAGSIAALTMFSFNRANETYAPTAEISACIESDFLRVAQHFILNPTSSMTGQIIINPSDPVSYAFGGQLFYSTSRHESRWVVPIAVRIVSSNATDEALLEPVSLQSFVDCSIETDSNYLWIPEPAYRALIAQIQGLNIRYSFNPHRFGVQSLVLHNITDSVVETLPSVQYLVLDDMGQQVSIQVLSPRNYLVTNMVDPQLKSLLLRTGSPQCDLSAHIVNRMLVHVDGIYGRLGFGEPLVEL